MLAVLLHRATCATHGHHVVGPAGPSQQPKHATKASTQCWVGFSFAKSPPSIAPLLVGPSSKCAGFLFWWCSSVKEFDDWVYSLIGQGAQERFCSTSFVRRTLWPGFLRSFKSVAAVSRMMHDCLQGA